MTTLHDDSAQVDTDLDVAPRDGADGPGGPDTQPMAVRVVRIAPQHGAAVDDGARVGQGERRAGSPAVVSRPRQWGRMTA